MVIVLKLVFGGLEVKWSHYPTVELLSTFLNEHKLVLRDQTPDVYTLADFNNTTVHIKQR